MNSCKITCKQLRTAGACEDKLAKFKKLHGESCMVTVKHAVVDAQLWDWDWLAENMLSSLAREAYDKATTQAREAYDKAIAPVREVYEKATTQTGEAYEKIKVTAREVYKKAIAQASEVYNKATTQTWEAYDKAIAQAWEVYNKAIAPVREVYEKAIALSWAEQYIKDGKEGKDDKIYNISKIELFRG